MNVVHSSRMSDVAPLVSSVHLPKERSHKGQNGKVLIIGGSPLFHAASLWSAEVASHFVDMVHYASTSENNDLFQSLKKIFRNGIIVHRDQIDEYIPEDDVILLGPGLERTEETQRLTEHVIKSAPSKQLVIDAGSLQMMKPEWLRSLAQPAIITPHQREFETLFSVPLSGLPEEAVMRVVRQKASEYHCVILMKAITDYITDGVQETVVRGGNQGLTKGGTGDILAGIVSGLRTMTNSVSACVLASYVLKRSADRLFSTHGYWYNNSHILTVIPKVVHELLV